MHSANQAAAIPRSQAVPGERDAIVRQPQPLLPVSPPSLAARAPLAFDAPAAPPMPGEAAAIPPLPDGIPVPPVPPAWPP